MIRSNERVAQSRATFIEQGLVMSGTLEGIAKMKRFNKEQMLKGQPIIEPEKNVPGDEVVANHNDEHTSEKIAIDNTVPIVDETKKGLFGVVERKFFKLFGR
ncbi:hypothetical protein [Vibrio alfacsensis]|uniref:hypothetical protein n=1 Tax=Vibrio alfacsensis TaxID=1074311 RepID=UPI004067720D